MMALGGLSSILFAITLGWATSSQAQQTPGDAPPAQDPPAAELGEVVVEGHRGQEPTWRFVRSSAPPIGDRSMARWTSSVCVGVLGMQGPAARMMADRISDWAHSLGLRIDSPGCEPNIIVVATDDAGRTARELVSSRPRQFRVGVPGADRGAGALAAFQHNDVPVRWWHVALPTNPDTGLPAVRLPGAVPSAGSGDLSRPSDFGTTGVPVAGSRLTRRIRDDLQQAIVVVDVDVLDVVGFGQLTDFVSMVALAHIDMRGDVTDFPSILNLFGAGGEPEPTLTDWDRAFLKALYGAEQTSSNPHANASDVADAMRRALDAPQ